MATQGFAVWYCRNINPYLGIHDHLPFSTSSPREPAWIREEHVIHFHKVFMASGGFLSCPNWAVKPTRWGGQEVELSSTQNETVYNQFPIWFHKKLHLTTSSVGTHLGFQHFTALSGIFSSPTEDCWSQNSVDSLFFFKLSPFLFDTAALKSRYYNHLFRGAGGHSAVVRSSHTDWCGCIWHLWQDCHLCKPADASHARKHQRINHDKSHKRHSMCVRVRVCVHTPVCMHECNPGRIMAYYW